MSAQAARRTAFDLFAGSAYDPTAADDLVAWQRPSGIALLRRGGADAALPGGHPALGGGRIAWRDGDRVTIAHAATLAVLDQRTLPGAGVLAISDAALVWRSRDEAGTDRLWLGDGQLVLESPAPTEIGRPALAGRLLLCHLAGPRGSQILAIDLASGDRTVLREDRGAQITNPSSDGRRLLYVHATGETQQLRIGPLAPADPDSDTTLLLTASPGRRDREHERGHHRHHQGYPHHHRAPLPPRARPGVVATLWTTALAPDTAYVTRLRAVRGKGRFADIIRVGA